MYKELIIRKPSYIGFTVKVVEESAECEGYIVIRDDDGCIAIEKEEWEKIDAFVRASSLFAK